MKVPTKKVKLREPIDFDKINIMRDHYFPEAYIIDLPLDSTPDHVWLDIFEQEWKSSRHLWDRKLYVLGDELRLVTTHSDIEDKLDWVKRVIEQTNIDIEKYKTEAEARLTLAEQQMMGQALEEEKARIELIKGIIRKQLGAA